MSSCTFNDIENNFRQSDPVKADYLTDLTLNIWSELKESKQFRFEVEQAGNNLYTSKPNTKKRQQQEKYISELNTLLGDNIVSINKFWNSLIVSTKKIINLPKAVDFSIFKYSKHKSKDTSIVKNIDAVNNQPFERDINYYKGDRPLMEQEENNLQYQLPQGRELEEYVTSEKTIRDLAARMANFDLFQNVDNSSPFEKLTYNEQQKLTKRIKEISEKQGDRIGIRNYDVYDAFIKNNRHKEAKEYKQNRLYLYKIINDKDEEYKGVTRVSDGIIYINLAYATLDTPIHEILGHPIIRALKIKSEKTIESEIDKMIEMGIIKKEC